MINNTIIIPGQTPSHKNSKRMFASKKTGKIFPANNDKYLAWKDLAVVNLKNSRVKIVGPIGVAATFFCEDNRPRDLDNMLASVQDALVSADVLADDNVKKLPFVFAKSGGVDKKNPRAEISFFAVAWDEETLSWNIDESVVKWF